MTLPGLMLSESPVSACSPCGIAQKAPARRGKNTNSSTASGSDHSSARPASLSAAPLSIPGEAMTASAVQHSHASPAYSGVRASASRSRQAASNRNSATPSMTPSSRALRVSSSFSAAISSSSVVPAARPLRVWYRRSTSATSASASSARATTPGYQPPRRAVASRQATMASAAPEAHNGSRSTCSSTPPVSAAQVQTSPGSVAGAAGAAADTLRAPALYRTAPAPRGSGGGAPGRRQAYAGQRQAVALAVRLGVDHPARQL